MDGAGAGAGVEPKIGFTFCCGLLVMFTFGLIFNDGVWLVLNAWGMFVLESSVLLSVCGRIVPESSKVAVL
jgi:hypothetical protein